MKNTKTLKTILICLLISAISFSQTEAETKEKKNKNLIQTKSTMNTYLIERDFPEAGKLSRKQLQDISKKSNEAVADIGPKVEWLHSYITENKVYCIYRAENKEAIKEHAIKGGFPLSNISELATKISPLTAQDE